MLIPPSVTMAPYSMGAWMTTTVGYSTRGHAKGMRLASLLLRPSFGLKKTLNQGAGRFTVKCMSLTTSLLAKCTLNHLSPSATIPRCQDTYLAPRTWCAFLKQESFLLPTGRLALVRGQTSSFLPLPADSERYTCKKTAQLEGCALRASTLTQTGSTPMSGKLMRAIYSPMNTQWPNGWKA